MSWHTLMSYLVISSNGDGIGVNISERKSGTERTKKRKKQEFVFFPPPVGTAGTVVHRLDDTPILPELR